jgi:hypothetical protein
MSALFVPVRAIGMRCCLFLMIVDPLPIVAHRNKPNLYACITARPASFDIPLAGRADFKTSFRCRVVLSVHVSSHLS